MGKLKVFWQRNKYEVSWNILFRDGHPGFILENKSAPFSLIKIKNDYWGADPLLFETDGKTYLFFELFNKKKKKGTIAVSEYVNNSFNDYKEILSEPFHLSFPFVFKYKGEYYMIPETGSVHKIILYKAKNFPFEWEKENVLLDNLSSSDNIVFHNQLISSIMDGNPSTCFNVQYELDEELKINKEICRSNSSPNGVRNAGPIFKYKNCFVRVGQYCPNNDYGKGLSFYKTDSFKTIDSFAFLKTILPEDIFGESIYSGIHTYSFSSMLECVDAKIVKKNSLFKMFTILMRRVFLKK